MMPPGGGYVVRSKSFSIFPFPLFPSPRQALRAPSTNSRPSRSARVWTARNPAALRSASTSVDGMFEPPPSRPAIPPRRPAYITTQRPPPRTTRAASARHCARSSKPRRGSRWLTTTMSKVAAWSWERSDGCGGRLDQSALAFRHGDSSLDARRVIVYHAGAARNPRFEGELCQDPWCVGSDHQEWIAHAHGRHDENGQAPKRLWILSASACETPLRVQRQCG